MVKIYIASFHRASDGALSKLIQKMTEKDLLTYNYKEADYILAVGDRQETFDFVLQRHRENYKIIHLWAGEIDQGTHDEASRHGMSIMSMMQLCTNITSKKRVEDMLRMIDIEPNAHVIGNVMLDNLEVDESNVPNKPYDVVLYNPPTKLDKKGVKKEIEQIKKLLDKDYVWIEPNGDMYTDLVKDYVNSPTLPRPQFLGLLKNCERFISNSSCVAYEAQFMMDKDNIISIGMRNEFRESKRAKMDIPNASDNIIKLFEDLE